MVPQEQRCDQRWWGFAERTGYDVRFMKFDIGFDSDLACFVCSVSS